MNPRQKYFKLKVAGSYAIVMFFLGAFTSAALASSNDNEPTASSLLSLSPWIWGLISGGIGLVLAEIGPAISALLSASSRRADKR